MHLFNNIFISTMVKSLHILKPLQKNFGKASILASCLNTRMTMCFCNFFWSPLQIIITIVTNLWSSCSSPLRDQPWLPCSPEVTKALYCSLWAKIIIIIQSWLGHWLFYVFLVQFVRKLGKKKNIGIFLAAVTFQFKVSICIHINWLQQPIAARLLLIWLAANFQFSCWEKKFASAAKVSDGRKFNFLAWLFMRRWWWCSVWHFRENRILWTNSQIAWLFTRWWWCCSV